MPSRKAVSNTALSVSSIKWQRVEQTGQRTESADTRGLSNEGVLMVQGRYVAQANGGVHLVVTVDPAAIDRKLAIRQVNDRIEGRSSRSGTFADSKVRR